MLRLSQQVDSFGRLRINIDSFDFTPFNKLRAGRTGIDDWV